MTREHKGEGNLEEGRVGPGVSLRPIRWPDDEAAVGIIDSSFSTNWIYRVHREPLSFRLEVETVNPPLRKSYGSAIRDDVVQVRSMQHVVVADNSGVLVGIVAAELSAWNRRVEIQRLYVTSDMRGRGVGRALVDSVVAFARSVGSWCVWLETQNTNYPAVQFYLKYGFHLVGLDERLYNPATQMLDEAALYFAIDLASG